jgi:predicted transcriptional regulator
MRSFLTTLLANLRGIVDELSDQNAYQRHLQAHKTVHSPEQWRRFQDEHWQAKARRGRCC